MPKVQKQKKTSAPPTKRNLSEDLSEQLVKNAMLLSSAERMAHLGSWELDLHPQQDAEPLQSSDEMYRIFGFKPRDPKIKTNHFAARIHPDDMQRVTDAFHKAIKKRKSHEVVHRIIRPDGTIRIVREKAEIIFNKSRKPVRLIGICQDITEQKQIEQELMEKEEILAVAQQIGRIGSWHMHIDEHSDIYESTLNCSKAACELFGRKNSQMKAKVFFNMVHPDDRKLVNDMLTKAIKHHQPIDVEHRLKTTKGGVRYVRQRANTIVDDAGKPMRIIGTVQDITESVQSRQALADRAQELERMNKIMVNRELRMIELKQEIADLKAQLRT